MAVRTTFFYKIGNSWTDGYKLNPLRLTPLKLAIGLVN